MSVSVFLLLCNNARTSDYRERKPTSRSGREEKKKKKKKRQKYFAGVNKEEEE
jgi:hypothetical protein